MDGSETGKKNSEYGKGEYEILGAYEKTFHNSYLYQIIQHFGDPSKIKYSEQANVGKQLEASEHYLSDCRLITADLRLLFDFKRIAYISTKALDE